MVDESVKTEGTTEEEDLANILDLQPLIDLFKKIFGSAKSMQKKKKDVVVDDALRVANKNNPDSLKYRDYVKTADKYEEDIETLDKLEQADSTRTPKIKERLNFDATDKIELQRRRKKALEKALEKQAERAL